MIKFENYFHHICENLVKVTNNCDENKTHYCKKIIYYHFPATFQNSAWNKVLISNNFL